MLPIYYAISIDQESIHSGSTKPSIMTVANTAGAIVGSYVVKVFKPQTLEQIAATNKEVYGSILASNFELNTPKAALVIVSQKIIDILNKKRTQKLRKGTYFATEYLENVFDYAEAKKMTLDDWEIETIFAFDVLIKNIDRRKKKPNLFFKGDDIYLIDHDSCFPAILLDQSFTDTLKDQEKYWYFLEKDNENGTVRKHLFLDQLRRQNKINPVDFDTFSEYLRILDVDILDNYQQQLQNTGNDTEDYYAIKSYLEEVKIIRAYLSSY